MSSVKGLTPDCDSHYTGQGVGMGGKGLPSSFPEVSFSPLISCTTSRGSCKAMLHHGMQSTSFYKPWLCSSHFFKYSSPIRFYCTSSQQCIFQRHFFETAAQVLEHNKQNLLHPTAGMPRHVYRQNKGISAPLTLTLPQLWFKAVSRLLALSKALQRSVAACAVHVFVCK